MVIIKNNCLPAKDYAAITIMFLIFIRKEWWLNANRYERAETCKHENWHVMQWSHVTLVSCILFSVANIWLNLAWSWMFASVFVYYVIYFMSYLFNLIRYREHSKAYHNIVFEKPAYKHDANCECGGMVCNYLNEKWCSSIIECRNHEKIVKDLKTALESSRKAEADLRKQLKLAEANIEGFSKNLDDANKQIAALNEEIVSYQNVVATLQAKIDELTKPEQEPEPEPEPENPEHDCKQDCEIGEAEVGESLRVH